MAINIFEGARRIALLCASLAIIGTIILSLTYEPYITVSYSIDFSPLQQHDLSQEDLANLSGTAKPIEPAPPKNPTNKHTTNETDYDALAKKYGAVDATNPAQNTKDFNPDAYLASKRYVIQNPQPLIKKQKNCPSNSGKTYFTSKLTTGEKISVNLCILAMSFGEKNEELIPYKIDEQGTIWGASTYSSEVLEYERMLETSFKIPLGDEKEIRQEFSEIRRKEIFERFGYLLLGILLFYGVIWAIGWIVRGFLGIPSGMDKRPD